MSYAFLIVYSLPKEKTVISIEVFVAVTVAVIITHHVTSCKVGFLQEAELKNACPCKMGRPLLRSFRKLQVQARELVLLWTP